MSDNLSFDRLSENQANPHTTYNDAMEKIDGAMSDALSVLVDDSDAVTLTAAQFENYNLFTLSNDSPAPDAAITITVPGTERGLFAVRNGCSYAATITISAQSETAPVCGPGELMICYSDGSNVRRIASVTDSDPINLQTGTSYTLAASDDGKIVEMSNASANTLTVPAAATVNFKVGARIDVLSYGAGQTTIAAASGVTINSNGGNLKLTGQYSGGSLYYRGSDTWVLIGDLSA